VVFAANAFSLMGMVSLFFLLEDLLDRFRYLSQGLAVILGYVALKMLLEDVVHPPEWINLVVVVVTLTVAALLSRRREAADAAASPGAPAPRTG
jgi:tellurite resistance protein TerC